MASRQSNGGFDTDLHQFVTVGEVSEQRLLFLRWAVANGRLDRDGWAFHAFEATGVESCDGKDGGCGICELCTGTRLTR